MSIKNHGSVSEALKGGGEVVPEAVSFDGVTDYLSRSADLVGNVDSKTFTFSCWVYNSPVTTTNRRVIYSSGVGANNFTDLFEISLAKSGDGYKIYGYYRYLLGFSSYSFEIPINTYFNLIISIDMNNTANRSVYINDKLIGGLTFSLYSNNTLGFTNNNHYIGNDIYTPTNVLKGRLSHLFLDYTYRDLSIEANRRLFITADGKPADWDVTKALNGILMLEMKDASTAHINSNATAGNFVQNGTLATADRGANQDNCVASYFDGVDDYQVNNSMNGLQTKTMTASAVVKILESATHRILYCNTDVPDTYSFIFIITTSDVRFIARNSSDVRFMEGQLALSTAIGSYIHVSFSVDTSDINKRHLIINGSNKTDSMTWTSYLDDFARPSIQGIIGSYNNSTAGCTSMELGELYFSTEYIDLSVNNPFWDSETNKPIPVRKAMANLGSNPLICMPIDASNPTKNYGSGGNFVLNGGGLLGSRGASEYQGRTIISDASNNVTGSIFCKSLVKWVNNVVSYSNDVTVTTSDIGTVGYYFGFSDTITWTEATRNLVTNQLGYMREPSKVISESGWTPVLGLFFEDSSNFGLNSYGVDFTVNGSPTSGADIVV